MVEPLASEMQIKLTMYPFKSAGEKKFLDITVDDLYNANLET